MGSIGQGISSALGGVGNGLSSLFGGGQANRAVGRDQNAAGAALGSATGAIGQEAPLLGQEGGSLGQASGALGGLGQAAGGAAGLAGQDASQYGQYEPGALNSFMTANGLNLDGTVNPNFDPLGNGVGSSLVGQYADKATGQGDAAVSVANKDMLGRGLGESSLNGSELGNIRRGQTQDVQDYTRNLGIQDATMKQNDIGNAVNMAMGLGRNAASGYDATGNLYGNLSSGYGNVARGYGANAAGYGDMGSGYGNVANGYTGQANMAQGQANALNQNLIGMAGMFA